MMRAILTKRLTFRGFIVSDFAARYEDFMRDVSAWVGEGRIKYREDVVEGLENAPRCACALVTSYATMLRASGPTVLQGPRLGQKAHLWRLNGLGHPSSQAFDLATNLLSHHISSSEEYAQNDQPSPTGNQLQRRRSRRQDHPGRARHRER